MFEIPIEKLNDFLNLNTGTIADLITIFIYIILIIITLKGSLSGLSIVALFTVFMGLLELLGVSSTFNIVTLLVEAF